ncbi:MAG: polya polymerase, partial [Bilophila sp.]|nr:polya polymerase [Bilophila sp.]
LPLESTLYLMARSDNEEISSSVSQYIYKWRQIKVDINGDDLHRLGLKPGPQFGNVMRIVLAAKLDGEAETREAQLKLAEGMIRKGLPGKGMADAAQRKPR